MRASAILLPLLVCCWCLVPLGCAGPDPVRVAQHQALAEGAAALAPLVEVGLAARQNSDVAARLGVAPLTPEAAEFFRDTLVLHRRIIEDLRARELGTMPPIPGSP